MIDDPDIWCAANALAKRCGRDAGLVVAQRANDALKRATHVAPHLPDVGELAPPKPANDEWVHGEAMR